MWNSGTVGVTRGETVELLLIHETRLMVMKALIRLPSAHIFALLRY